MAICTSARDDAFDAQPQHERREFPRTNYPEENTPASLPVLTVGRVEHLRERAYRERCVVRLVEIGLDIEHYLGAGRLFIP